MSEELIELVGLPEGCTVHWSRLHKSQENHVYNEDMVYITLKNGLTVDAGQYGRVPFFNVMVISGENWDAPVENCICQTTQEVADSIIRLANKYSEEWFSNIALIW